MTPPRATALVLWALALGSHAAGARADNYNRNLLPIGEREAALANTGITSPTGAAVFYNPGNLARLSHSTISMSGTTLLRVGSSAQALDEQPMSTSGFMVIPMSLVSTYRVGSLALATGVLVPDHLEQEMRSTYEVDGRSTTLFTRNARRDLWLGGSAAYQIDKLSLGVSVFGVRRSASSLFFIQLSRSVPNEPAPMPAPATSATTEATGDAVPAATAPAGEHVVAAHVLGNQSSDVIGATAIIGAHCQFTPWLGAGARVQTPLWQIYRSGDSYSSVVGSHPVDGASPVRDRDVRGVKVNDPMPFDMGVGVSVKPHPRVELLGDLNVQMPLKYHQNPMFDGEEMAEEEELKLTPRVSFAADVRVLDSLSVQAGGLYSPSAQADVGDPDEAAEAYAGFTGGLRWKSGRTTTGIGGFFVQSKGKTRSASLLAALSGVDEEDNLPYTSVRTRLFGALLTVAYEL